VAVLAEVVRSAELKLARAGLLLATDPPGMLVVGPDDLEEVVRFQGFDVFRVEHWQGGPVLAVPGGDSVATAYHVARQITQYEAAPPESIRAFGPPGWEHVSIPLMRGRQQNRVDFVPVTGLAGPMIGVELT
jgi:hypothetical protein